MLNKTIVVAVATVLGALLLFHGDAAFAQDARPLPDFPLSEQSRGRDGWILLTADIAEDGKVIDTTVTNSSGNPDLIKATRTAMEQWQFEPIGPRQVSVLMSFAFDRKQPRMSRKVFGSNAKIHDAIAAGDFDAAEKLIRNVRRSRLNAFEYSMTLLAEARIAGERGDKQRQLDLFRLATMNDGRWLERDNYLKLLHTMTVLEIQLHDYGSALRDYDELSKTIAGKILAENLDEPISKIRAHAESGAQLPPAFKLADFEMIVEREANPLRKDGEFDNGFPVDRDEQPEPAF